LVVIYVFDNQPQGEFFPNPRVGEDSLTAALSCKILMFCEVSATEICELCVPSRLAVMSTQARL